MKGNTDMKVRDATMKQRAWAIVRYPPHRSAPGEQCHIDGWYFIHSLAVEALRYWREQYPDWGVVLVCADEPANPLAPP
jgi:hypothetical protein